MSACKASPSTEGIASSPRLRGTAQIELGVILEISLMSIYSSPRTPISTTRPCDLLPAVGLGRVCSPGAAESITGWAMPEGYLDVQPSPTSSKLPAIAAEMFGLMMRNVTSNDVVYTDPLPPHKDITALHTNSRAGCVLASPSWPQDPNTGKQDYVNNWTRDAAITMMEILAAGEPTISPDEVKQRMSDYIAFAARCQQNALQSGEFSIACFRIDGQPRCDMLGVDGCWSAQNDGPALQTLAILSYYENLADPDKTTARQVMEANLKFLLDPGANNGPPGYQAKTTSPWEEETGYSFFARATQLRCLLAIQEQSYDLTVPPALNAAVTWLQGKLAAHWDEQNGYYCTFEPGTDISPNPSDAHRDPYDPNSDILMACVYGAVPVTDPKLLSSAAKIRAIYENKDTGYPVNQADNKLGYGPLIGRYPGDFYDGDVQDSPTNKDHPWILCSCNLAEIYYRLASAIEIDNTALPSGPLVEQFYEQIQLAANPGPQAAATALRAAADSIVEAVVYHSDNLELSEQVDQTTGFQKSVSNLTWSYAAFLSAVRAGAAGLPAGGAG